MRNLTIPLLIITSGLAGCAAYNARTDRLADRIANEPAFARVHPSPTANYVQVFQTGYHVAKTFPTIFFVDEPTPSNHLMRDFAIVLTPEEERKIALVAAAHCAGAAKLANGDEDDNEDEVRVKYFQQGLIVRVKSQTHEPEACFIAEPNHCSFFREIKTLDYSNDSVKTNEYLIELEDRMDCPNA